MNHFSNTGRPWPHDKSQPTTDTRVVSIAVHDWRWQRFNEDAVTDPDEYPIYGWKRLRLEETESGQSYEIREWHFGVNRPSAGFGVAA